MTNSNQFIFAQREVLQNYLAKNIIGVLMHIFNKILSIKRTVVRTTVTVFENHLSLKMTVVYQCTIKYRVEINHDICARMPCYITVFMLDIMVVLEIM